MARFYFLAYFIFTSCLVSGESPQYVLKGTSYSLMPNIPEGHLSSILWKYNGNKVVDFNGREQQEFGPFEDRVTLDWHSGELEIKELRFEDSGDYVLEVDINGNLHTSQHKLEVIEKVVKPTISCEMNEGSSSDGTKITATLLCSAKPRKPESLMKFEWKSKGMFHSGQKLPITLGDEYDEVEYNCSVSNPLSRETASFTAKECYTGSQSVALAVGLSISILLLLLLLGIVGVCFCRQKACFAPHDPEKQLTTEGTGTPPEERRRLLERNETLPSHQRLPQVEEDQRPQKGMVKEKIELFNKGINNDKRSPPQKGRGFKGSVEDVGEKFFDAPASPQEQKGDTEEENNQKRDSKLKDSDEEDSQSFHSTTEENTDADPADVSPKDEQSGLKSAPEQSGLENKGEQEDPGSTPVSLWRGSPSPQDPGHDSDIYTSDPDPDQMNTVTEKEAPQSESTETEEAKNQDRPSTPKESTEDNPQPDLKPEEDPQPGLKPEVDPQPGLKPEVDPQPDLKPEEDPQPDLKPEEDPQPDLKPEEDPQSDSSVSSGQNKPGSADGSGKSTEGEESVQEPDPGPPVSEIHSSDHEESQTLSSSEPVPSQDQGHQADVKNDEMGTEQHIQTAETGPSQKNPSELKETQDPGVSESAEETAQEGGDSLHLGGTSTLPSGDDTNLSDHESDPEKNKDSDKVTESPPQEDQNPNLNIKNSDPDSNQSEDPAGEITSSDQTDSLEKNEPGSADDSKSDADSAPKGPGYVQTEVDRIDKRCVGVGQTSVKRGRDSTKSQQTQPLSPSSPPAESPFQEKLSPDDKNSDPDSNQSKDPVGEITSSDQTNAGEKNEPVPADENTGPKPSVSEPEVMVNEVNEPSKEDSGSGQDNGDGHREAVSGSDTTEDQQNENESKKSADEELSSSEVQKHLEMKSEEGLNSQQAATQTQQVNKPQEGDDSEPESVPSTPTKGNISDTDKSLKTEQEKPKEEEQHSMSPAESETAESQR